VLNVARNVKFHSSPTLTDQSIVENVGLREEDLVVGEDTKHQPCIHHMLIHFLVLFFLFLVMNFFLLF
jgi:hypothetical protein